jgi:hypothetical protein
MGAIEIHHHYVPEQIIEEARHGKTLGIEVFEDKFTAFPQWGPGIRYGSLRM